MRHWLAGQNTKRLALVLAWVCWQQQAAPAALAADLLRARATGANARATAIVATAINGPRIAAAASAWEQLPHHPQNVQLRVNVGQFFDGSIPESFVRELQTKLNSLIGSDPGALSQAAVTADGQEIVLDVGYRGPHESALVYRRLIDAISESIPSVAAPHAAVPSEVGTPPAVPPVDDYEPPSRVAGQDEALALRERFQQDPVGMWGKIARREAAWYDQQTNAWLAYDPASKTWKGYRADTGEPVTVTKPAGWAPWRHTFSWFDRQRGVWKAFNPQTGAWEEFPRDPADLIPLFKYFDGGRTNIAFNALDAHVLAGRGDMVIDTVELEPTNAEGQPAQVRSYTYREMLTEVVQLTDVLKRLGLKTGDKIALSLPNGIEWKIAALAAARLGLTYTPPFALRGPNELRDQMKDLGARVLITVDGYFHNGALNHHKIEKVDVALRDYDAYVHVDDARRAIEAAFEAEGIAADARAAVLTVYDTAKDEGGFGGRELITTHREKLEPFVRDHLTAHGVAAGQQNAVVARIFAALETRAAETNVQHVLVFQREPERTRLQLAGGRDRWVHVDLQAIEAALLTQASRMLGRPVESRHALDALSADEFMRVVAAFAPPVPVPAEHPLFAIYTSGSTGKPKGALHTTGGYMVGLKYTIGLVQNFRAGDTFMVYADPGWITGQSAQLYAPYLAGLPSVTYQGAVNQPHATRLLDIMERHHVTLFKAGAPVLRGFRAAGSEAFAGRQLALRQCLNCAEPGDPQTQAFIDSTFGKGVYKNNLWRTEDGFQTFGTTDDGVPQADDASVYPLPFAQLEVIVEERDDAGKVTGYHVGQPGELGLLVAKTHPHMVRTLVGDEPRFLKTYWGRFDARTVATVAGLPPADVMLYGSVFPDWHLVGDAGRKVVHDGLTHFIVPGRADDVINVSGNRIGTRDIEAGLVEASDRAVVREAAAIGIPHPATGQTPIAFVTLQPGVQGNEALEQSLRSYLEETRSPHYRPSEIFWVSSIPLTLSGKNMRRFLSYVGSLRRRELREVLRKLGAGGDALAARIRAKDHTAVDELFPGLGNITSLANPESIIEVVRVVAAKRGLGRSPRIPPRASADDVDLSLYQPSAEREAQMIARGELLPKGARIVPGITPIPAYMRAAAVVKGRSGAPHHGQPKDVLRDVVVRTRPIGPNEYRAVPLYVGGTYNIVWAALGIPVSVFDSHDEDVHIPGSGAVGLVVEVGEEAAKQGRVRVGDVVFSFPFETDVNLPTAGANLSFASPRITGFETPWGMAAEFYTGQVQNAFPLPANLPKELTFAHLASLSLDLPTVWKAVLYAGRLQQGERMFMEGAAGGTGIGGVTIGALKGGKVTGLVSTEAKGAFVKEHGAHAFINRTDAAFTGIWTNVPADPAQWAEWEARGQPLIDAFKAANHDESGEGRLADVIISHVGRTMFGRDVQLLADGGRLVFYGASSGYDLSFMGKPGSSTPGEMLNRAHLKPDEGVVIYYGNEPDLDADGMDQVGLDMIQAAIDRHAKIVVVTRTGAQEIVLRERFGERLKGIVNLELLESDPYFEWREMPDADVWNEDGTLNASRLADLQDWEEYTFKKIGQEIGSYLATRRNPRGNPHVILERASQNTLALSGRLVMPYFGRVVFSEDMQGRRYNFYAPSIWMFQKRMLLPTVEIIGSHMADAYQTEEVVERVLRRELPLAPPTIRPAEELAAGMQDVLENRHQGSMVFRFNAPEDEFRSQAALLSSVAGYEFPEGLADQTNVKTTLVPLPSGQKLATLVLTNPPVNALNREMLEEIILTLEQLRDRRDVKAVLVTGAGANNFVAGQDIRQLFRMTAPDAAAQAHRAHQALSLIETFPKPVLIVVNGAAVGGGNEAVMAAPLAISAVTARHAQTEVNLFLMAGYGATQRLPRLIEQELLRREAERQGVPTDQIDDILTHEQEMIQRERLRLGVRTDETLIAPRERIRVEAPRRAAHVLLSGRFLSADEAKTLGLVHDAVADPQRAAYELIRAYDATSQGVLADAWKLRQTFAARWKAPAPLPADWASGDLEIQRLLEQGAQSHPSPERTDLSRRHAMEQALRAIEIGYAQGIDAGYAAEAEMFGELVGSEAGKLGMDAFTRKESPPLPPRPDVRIDDMPEVDGGTPTTAKRSPGDPGLTPEEAHMIDEIIAEKQADGRSALLSDELRARVVDILRQGKAPRVIIDAIRQQKIRVNVIDMGEERGFPRLNGSRPLFERPSFVAVPDSTERAIVAINLAKAFIDDNRDTPEGPHVIAQAIVHPLLEDILPPDERLTHLEASQVEAVYNSPDTAGLVLSDLNRYILRDAARRGDEEWLARLVQNDYRVSDALRQQLHHWFGGNVAHVEQVVRRAIELARAFDAEAFRLLTERAKLFKDQVVVVTGGGTGLGRETALAFARSGAHVVLMGRRREPLEATARQIHGMGRRALVIPGDVSNNAEIARLFEEVEREFGRLDVLIGNAGVSGDIRALHRQETGRNEGGAPDFRQTVRIHLGTWSMAQAGAALARKTGRPLTVINVATKFAPLSRADAAPYPYRLPYTIGQAVKVAVGRALAWELANDDVSVVSIAFGPAAGDRIEQVVYPQGATERELHGVLGTSAERIRSQTADMHPGGRFVELAEVADSIAFAATSSGRRLGTGEAWSMSGGLDYRIPPSTVVPTSVGRVPDLSGQRVLVIGSEATSRVETARKALEAAGASVVVAPMDKAALIDALKREFLDDHRPLNQVVVVSSDVPTDLPFEAMPTADRERLIEDQAVAPFGIAAKLAVNALIYQSLQRVPEHRAMTFEEFLAWDERPAEIWGPTEQETLQRALKAVHGRVTFIGPEIFVPTDAAPPKGDSPKRQVEAWRQGVKAATESLAAEQSGIHTNVRVNAVLPGRLTGAPGDPKALARSLLYLTDPKRAVSGLVLYPDERNAQTHWEGTLAGRTAIVTGGGKNIGREITEALARRGADVVITGRDAEALEATVANVEAIGANAAFVEGNVTDPDHVAAAFRAAQDFYSGADIVVNNAGVAGNAAVAPDKPLATIAEIPLQTNPAEPGKLGWLDALAVHVTGSWLTIKQAVDLWADRGTGGMIVNNSTHYAGQPYFLRGIYTGTKALQQAMTPALHRELSAYGIAITDIAPSLVRSDRMAQVVPGMTGGAQARGADTQSPAFQQLLHDLIPDDPPTMADVAARVVQAIEQPATHAGKVHTVSRWSGEPSMDRKGQERVTTSTAPALLPDLEGQHVIISGHFASAGLRDEALSLSRELLRAGAGWITVLAPAEFSVPDNLAGQVSVQRLDRPRDEAGARDAFQQAAATRGPPGTVFYLTGNPVTPLLDYADVNDFTQRFLDPYVTAPLLAAREALGVMAHTNNSQRQGAFIVIGPHAATLDVDRLARDDQSAFLMERGIQQLLRVMLVEHQAILNAPDFRAYYLSDVTGSQRPNVVARWAAHLASPANRALPQTQFLALLPQEGQTLSAAVPEPVRATATRTLLTPPAPEPPVGAPAASSLGALSFLDRVAALQATTGRADGDQALRQGALVKQFPLIDNVLISRKVAEQAANAGNPRWALLHSDVLTDAPDAAIALERIQTQLQQVVQKAGGEASAIRVGLVMRGASTDAQAQSIFETFLRSLPAASGGTAKQTLGQLRILPDLDALALRSRLAAADVERIPHLPEALQGDVRSVVGPRVWARTVQRILEAPDPDPRTAQVGFDPSDATQTLRQESKPARPQRIAVIGFDPSDAAEQVLSGSEAIVAGFEAAATGPSLSPDLVTKLSLLTQDGVLMPQAVPIDADARPLIHSYRIAAQSI